MKNELKEELGILEQSLVMYRKTREEMVALNRSTELIDAEIKQIEARVIALRSDERIEKYTDKEFTIEEVPLKANHFLILFPEEFDIKPYAINNVNIAEGLIFLTLREFEDENPILPIRLSQMTDKKFDIKVQILKSDKSVYYTMIYEGCKLFDTPAMPSLQYNSSEVSLWSLTFSYDKVQYEA